MNKISIIILASGSSKRFNGNKLLYPINGKPMIEWSLINATLLKERLSIIDEVVVVSKYDEILKLTQKYNLKYINNFNSNEGITASIHLGVLHSKNHNDFMFMVGDEPYLSFETLHNFINGYLKSNLPLACLCDEDLNTSNPCIFSYDYKDDLLKLSSDRGGKTIILKNMDKVYLHKAPKNELMDIDYLIK